MNKQIVFTTDVFRIEEKIGMHILDYELFSVYQMFCEQIKNATSITPALSLARNDTFFDFKHFYKLCKYELNQDNWFKICTGLITPEAEEYFINTFKNHFIITYHANPFMLRLFQKYNIDYIDIFEGSVRFLEDIHFVMRTANTEIYKKLIEYEYPKEHIIYEAARLKSHYKFYGVNENKIKDNSLLLCGQTNCDISLLKDKKCVEFSDFENKFASIVKDYDYIYYMPHPYVKNDEPNRKFISKYSNYEISNHNFYAMMASAQIKGVMALSSGTLTEAKYFGKNVHILYKLYADYYDGKNIDINKFVILKDDYYSPTFWADILSPVFEVNKVKYFNFNNRSNWIRDNAFHYWGYQFYGTRFLKQELENRIIKIEKIIENKPSKIAYKKFKLILKHLVRKIIGKI